MRRHRVSIALLAGLVAAAGSVAPAASGGNKLGEDLVKAAKNRGTGQSCDKP